MLDIEKRQAEIEKIKTYIAKHGAPCNLRFSVNVRQASAVAFGMHPIEAFDLAFLYGKAKGYQQAKKELQQKNA